MKGTKIFTIGFTKKKAEKFFNMLASADVTRVVDVRLNNVSQLAGFAKRDDLRFFLKTICNMDYIHMPELAPTKKILNAFKGNKGDWAIYEKEFFALLSERQIEDKISMELMNNACLLCSEEKPDYCHRRLIAEYLKKKWKHIEIIHLV
jgi:uncharacterized protein (DUF488 family)